MIWISSSIVQELEGMCDLGLALMGFYYFDSNYRSKQDLRGLVASLLAQLCAKSDACYDILSMLYSKNDAGSRQPDDYTLIECLKAMLQLPAQPTIYIITDALDECHQRGHPTARESVLNVFEELVHLDLPNLRICVTSRAEIDIQHVLAPCVQYRVSLDDEIGQKEDILHYIENVVRTDRKMRRWREEDKQSVIETLSAKADGA
jgi:hypothetical protein